MNAHGAVPLELPSGAVVPHRDDARRIRRALHALPYRVHRRWLTTSLDRMSQEMGERLVPAMRRSTVALAAFGAECRRQGLIPPDARALKHGTVWTSPLDGHQVRVRGRRGRRQTFHWGRP